MELVPLLHDRIVQADALVDVRGVVPRGIEGSRIGAGTTLAEIEASDAGPAALREACRQAASPQLRAMGSVGGNLLQATRCWYWRLQFPCWLHGGETCLARTGEHREHAIFGNDRCASAHPSDIAAALLALDATIRTTERELPLAGLYRLPTDDDRSTTTLAKGELILEIDVPEAKSSIYLKAMDRRKWAFPIVGVAAARTVDGVRLGVSGVAPIPWAIESLDDLENHPSVGERRHPAVVLGRQPVQLGERQLSAVRPNRRVEREQRRRHVRRVRRRAVVVAEDRVLAVLALAREALVAAVQTAGPIQAPVPAAGRLQEVSRKRSHVAQLR
jgi:xanthine dehydrogenase YagS FAD-binding subunit